MVSRAAARGWTMITQVSASRATLLDVRALHRDLVERRKRLQWEKANCEQDFKLYAQHPEHYREEKIIQIRAKYHAVNTDLDHIMRQEASLVADNPLLRAELQREFGIKTDDAKDGQASEGDQEKSKTGSTRVTLRRPSDLIARPISWCVESIIPDGMLTVLHARDKIGKTLLAWEAARAMLRHEPLLGTFPTKAGRVVLALLDDPHDLTVERRDALRLKDCEDLRIVTPMDADLSDPLAFLAEFKKECEEFKPNLIVLDALYQFAPPGKDSMNDVARMRGVMAEFNALAETLPAAVLLIAHDKKDGSDVAGSYAIRATAKALLHLTKPKWSKEEEEEDDGRRMLTVVSKLTGESRHLLRNQGVGAWTYLGRGDSARQARTTWAQNRVLTWLTEGNEGTAEEIAKGVKIRKEDALAALSELVENGQAESELMPRTDGKKGKGRLVYRLMPNVPEAGNISSKGKNGNNRFGSLEPAKIATHIGIPIVPPALNQAGTIGQSENPIIDGAFCEEQTYCSQTPLFSAGTIAKAEEGEL